MMMENRTALIVDDDEAIRDSCRKVLERQGMTVLEAKTGAEALNMIEKDIYSVVLLDLKLPASGGVEVLERISAAQNRTPVIIITGYPSVDTAVRTMKMGAVDYIVKPFSASLLRCKVMNALDGFEKEGGQVHEETTPGKAAKPEEKLIGDSAPMRALRETILQVARTESTVLLDGESGTGKEVAARMLHAHSRRRRNAFQIVDCATLVGSLMENELFGHEKGAFTGAASVARGRFEKADGGTLFLDEIGSVDVSLQAKLLRAIERGEYTRVGGNETIGVDVRVIAATNSDLRRAVADGNFRDDLYYRLSVVPIHLPPLRRRCADIPALARHFLQMHSQHHGRKEMYIGEDAMKILMAHDWPGNVRELSNAIERAVVLAEGERITSESLLHYGYAYGRGGAPALSSQEAGSLEELEMEHIRKTLHKTGGNKAAAARLLGIDRKTLWRKLNREREA